MPHFEQYLYTKLGTLIRGKEFKANVIIRALLRMPYSVQQYVLLKTPYLEQYLYTKLSTPIRGREFRVGKMRLFGVGHSEQDMRLYIGIGIRSALLQISALSGALLLIKQFSGWKNYMSLLVCQYKIHFRLISLSALRSYVFILLLSWALLIKHINLQP